MKKLFAFCIAAAMISFMACGGGNDKEKAAKLADSLKKDSIMKDSIAQAEKAAREADSIKAAAADTTKKEEKKDEKKVK